MATIKHPLEQEIDKYQAEFFKRLNSLVIPGLKRGLGSPGVVPAGLLLLDVVGRKSGVVYPTPVFAAALGEGFLVGTVRGQSQWIRNLAAADSVSFWLKGDQHEAHPRVFAPDAGSRPDMAGLALRTKVLLQLMRTTMTSIGGGFALLETRATGVQT